MATISSLLGQNSYTGLYKSSKSSWYQPQLASQMFGQQQLAANNDQKLISILQKNAAAYEKNMAQISEYNSASKPFFNEFNSKLGDLQDSSAALKNYSNSSVFNPTGFSSSDSKVATVTSSGAYNAKDISINVKQVATGESIATKAINSKETGTLGGYSTMSITTGEGKSTNLKFNFTQSTSAADAMKSIAQSVNSAKIGVNATVVEKDGKSSLEFTNANTGEKATLNISMSSNLKNALDPTTKTEAKNASYTVNGTDFTSQTNNIKVGDSGSVNVTLKAAGETTLGKGEMDTKSVVDAVKTFANDVNNALSFLKSNSNKSTAVRGLTNSLSTFRYRESSFRDIGIEISGSKMKVNEEKLTKALKDNPDRVKNLLGGNSGFAAETNKTVTSALQKQTQFMPPPNIDTGSSFSYSNNSSGFNNFRPYSGTVIDWFA